MNEFEKNKYAVVRNVLDRQSQLFCFEYIKVMVERYKVIRTKFPNWYDKSIHGYAAISLNPDWDLVDIDGQDISLAYSKYGDTFTDTMLLTMKENIEHKTELDLIPTYSFLRLYKKGDVLTKHTDRPQCEISVSLCVGCEGELSPLMIEGIPIYLEAGDMVIYRGCELEHWREPLRSEMQAQIFLHYNDNSDDLYDGRQYVGLPHLISPRYQ